MAVDIAQLLAFAVKNKASDLHLSAGMPPMIRVDGEIKRVNMPALSHKSVHSMVYDMMNDKQRKAYEEFFETDFSFEIPQLARFRVNAFNQNRGAGAVFRTIPSAVMTLEELNAPKIFRDLCGLARGLVLVTGPTGSGKTTTLYSCLHHINKPDRKIITVEDPVEYQLNGINQVPVRADVGMTFASALRSMLRQAPNIVMIGEIRDLETAEIAINASLTGHMVFSTLHTNDAPSAVTRLIDIGVKPFLVSTSLRAVLAQRLVRKICPKCTQPYQPTAAELRSLNISPAMASAANFAKGTGCANCNGTGFRGRLVIVELFLINEDVQRLIYENTGSARLRDKARSFGMRTMREDGLRKVTAGLTTIDEVVSITVGDAS